MSFNETQDDDFDEVSSSNATQNAIDLNVSTPDSAVSHKKTKKSSAKKKEDDELQAISSTLRQVAEDRKQRNAPPVESLSAADECDVFGRFVGSELSAITDQFNRDMTKKRITDALFEAKLQQAGSGAKQIMPTPQYLMNSTLSQQQQQSLQLQQPTQHEQQLEQQRWQQGSNPQETWQNQLNFGNYSFTGLLDESDRDVPRSS
jgi:hypothetical protein